MIVLRDSSALPVGDRRHVDVGGCCGFSSCPAVVREGRWVLLNP